MNREPNQLGKVISKLRTQRKLSYRSLGKITGISHAYLCRLEHGFNIQSKKEIIPTIRTLEKLAEGFNISLDFFLELAGFFDDTD